MDHQTTSHATSHLQFCKRLQQLLLCSTPQVPRNAAWQFLRKTLKLKCNIFCKIDVLLLYKLYDLLPSLELQLTHFWCKKAETGSLDVLKCFLMSSSGRLTVVWESENCKRSTCSQVGELSSEFEKLFAISSKLPFHVQNRPHLVKHYMYLTESRRTTGRASIKMHQTLFFCCP